VVRRPRDDEVVQRRVDERGLRQFHGGENRQSVVPRSITICGFSSRTTRQPTTSIARRAQIPSGRSWPI
jgi:hypothetical protein